MNHKICKSAKGQISLLFVICSLLFSVACTDTWDDHYDNVAQDVNGGSLWQAIQADASLSNFASVIQATGYDKSLGSSQVFTVFAPTNDNFPEAEAQALIAEYEQQKLTVNDEDNTVIKEFVQNHIALYNHSVSAKSNDSLVMMNGKYAILKSGSINGSSFAITNKLYENGVLFTVGRPVDYSANIFELIRKDADLDSVRSFLYNDKFYKKVFSPGSSVEGGLDSLGRTVYLDSVFYQQNELYSYVGRIASEDSTYWMVLPTNEAWAGMVGEYSQYFVYPPAAANLIEQGDLDSLAYTNTRLAILQGSAFSQTSNYDIVSGAKATTTDEDSIRAFPYVYAYNMRQALWGANFNYYTFFNPLSQGGLFYGAERTDCSNGAVFKTSDWPIDKLQTFARWRVFECESSLKEVGKYTDKNELRDGASYQTKSVQNRAFRDRVWNNRYIEFQPVVSRYTVTFNLEGLLSNFGYDIYMVTAPALANDSNATATEGLPTNIMFTLNYPDATGKAQAYKCNTSTSEVEGVITSNASGQWVTTGTKVDYLLLAEDFKFPVATYGLNESEPMITLTAQNNSRPTDQSQQRAMRFDCILLVPHGTLQLTDELGMYNPAYSGPGVLMFPHGMNKWQYVRLR